jgi:hypothetical protein
MFRFHSRRDVSIAMTDKTKFGERDLAGINRGGSLKRALPDAGAVVFHRVTAQNRNVKRLGGADSGLIFIGIGMLAAKSIDQPETSA